MSLIFIYPRNILVLYENSEHDVCLCQRRYLNVFSMRVLVFPYSGLRSDVPALFEQAVVIYLADHSR